MSVMNSNTQAIVENSKEIITIGQQMSENISVYFLLAFTLLFFVVLYAFKVLWERTTKLMDGLTVDVKKIVETNERLSLYIVKDMASIKEKISMLSDNMGGINNALLSSLDLTKTNKKEG